MNPAVSKVHSACFNAQQDCFAVATDSGIQLFNSHPAVLLRSFSREEIGGVKVTSILHRSNIIVFVGGGSYAKYPSNTVMVWDDKQQELVLEVPICFATHFNFYYYLNFMKLQDRGNQVVLAQVGSVQLVNLNNMSECASLSPRGIDAHLNEITQLALNNQATLLATGSTKGTVIRYD
ncbi:unnamed protein product [Strongylus vulgaris]|uniref:Uncharacterized protein n=1 Tax=Strongylus vulgaris TaxID=40348 RepID=A0A3P7IRI2_STRVU|nr:unnamed protein product [Strongylus vulgaris]